MQDAEFYIILYWHIYLEDESVSLTLVTSTTLAMGSLCDKTAYTVLLNAFSLKS